MPSCTKSSASSTSSKSSSTGKAPHQVHRRNERERKRVQQINNGYVRLRDSLNNYQTNSRKLSKVETLKAAIAYIAKLQDTLHTDPCVNNVSSGSSGHDHSFSSDYSFNSLYSSSSPCCDYPTQAAYGFSSPDMAFDFQAYLRQQH